MELKSLRKWITELRMNYWPLKLIKKIIFRYRLNQQSHDHVMTFELRLR